MSLLEDIQNALNRNGARSGSNTPDFILAEYLVACLATFDATYKAREKWYGGGGAPWVTKPGDDLSVSAESGGRGSISQEEAVAAFCAEHKMSMAEFAHGYVMLPDDLPVAGGPPQKWTEVFLTEVHRARYDLEADRNVYELRVGFRHGVDTQ